MKRFVTLVLEDRLECRIHVLDDSIVRIMTCLLLFLFFFFLLLLLYQIILLLTVVVVVVVVIVLVVVRITCGGEGRPLG